MVVSWLKRVAVTGMGVLVVACGGTGQDEGTPANIQTALSGRAIDGHLARATVFVDTNNNGARDPWEDRAFTDNDGYFSFNPLTNTDYCASTATAEAQQYCLQLRVDIDKVVIRIDSGYDIQTGEPLVGQLSRRITVAEQDSSNMIISPLTSLVTAQESEAAQEVVLSRLGISRADLDVDYLQSDAVATDLLNLAVKVHKTVALLADRLTDTYDKIGENLGTPNDASKAVYDSLAQTVWASTTSFAETVAQQENLLATIDRAENSLRDIYTRRELSLPQDQGSREQPGNFSRTVQVAQQLGSIVDNLIPKGASLNLQQATGGVRALETVVIKAVKENFRTDTGLDNAVAFFQNPDNSYLVQSLTDALANPNADLTQLVNNDFTGEDFDSPEDFAAQVLLPAGAEPFSNIAGSKVQLSDPDLGSAPNNLRDIEVLVYFNGDSGSSAGEVLACAKYIEGAKADGSLGEGNTRGTLVNGYWSLLTSAGSTQSNSLLLTLNLLGGTYQAVIKPGGTTTVDGEVKQVLRFDFDGDIRSWHTQNGFELADTPPESSVACEQRLPSRVGL